MVSSPILSFALWFPIIGGFIDLLCGLLFEKIQSSALKFVALGISFVSLILSSIPVAFFEPSYSEMQFVEKTVWIKDLGVNYFLGVDGISIFFLPLTSLITLIVILSAWDVIKDNLSLYFGNFLIMSGLLIGVFYEHRLNRYAQNADALLPFGAAWPLGLLRSALEPLHRLTQDDV